MNEHDADTLTAIIRETPGLAFWHISDDPDPADPHGRVDHRIAIIQWGADGRDDLYEWFSDAWTLRKRLQAEGS